MIVVALLVPLSGIEYKMPLCRSSDALLEGCSSSSVPGSSSVTSKTCYEEEEGEKEEEGDAADDGEEATSFLANLGVDTSQFANLNPNRVNA